MALHSIDKSINRDNPKPNTHDTLQDVTRQAHGTTSVHPTTDATQDIGYLQTKNGRILVNNGSFDVLKAGLLGANSFGFETLDASNVRTFAGNHPTYGQGFFVSKAGSDASSATGNDLIFNSSQDIFKIVSSGTVTVSGSYSHGTGSQNTIINTQTITHSLGFAPVMLVFVYNPNIGIYEPASSGSLATDDVGISFSSTYNLAFVRVFGVDSSTATFSIRYKAYLSAGSTSGSISETYKYFLLQETAT